MPWQRVIGPPESEKTATSSLASSCQLEDGDLARVRVAEKGDDDVEQAQLPVHGVPELGRVVEHDGGLEEEEDTKEVTLEPKDEAKAAKDSCPIASARALNVEAGAT